MNAITHFLTALFLLALPVLASAQEVPHSALEGTFFQSAKFYVVVAVVLIILVGMFAYLFVMDKRLKALEKELD